MQANSKILLKFKNFNDVSDIEAVYKQFIFFLTEPNAQQLVLDLTSVSFVFPETALTLICIGRLWRMHQKEAIKLILNPETQKYLERINFFNVVANFLVPTIEIYEKYSRNEDNRTLLEIMPISSEPEQNALDIYHISEQVQRILSNSLADQLSSTCTLISELAENVIHSDDKAFIQIQRYKDYFGSNSGSRIHIGIADLGIGIEASLKSKYPYLGTGSKYLLRSLEMGVTCRVGSGGLGLHRVQKIVEGGRGTLVIRSGGSMVQVYDNKNYRWDNLPNILGTQIYITIWGEHPA